MATTQEHIPIEDIKDGVLILKNGGATIVLKTSAVNFGLLSADEQMAIIGSFDQMLNSLSFAIQIVILSRRLDISAYLLLLDKAMSLQTNPLLAQLMINYHQFVQSLIKDNEVLDKSFYIAVTVSSLEMGLGSKTKEGLLKKAKTILEPRRDQVMRQLSRIGLKSDQLDDRQLLQLFYEIYNPPENQIPDVRSQISENKPAILGIPHRTVRETSESPPLDSGPDFVETTSGKQVLQSRGPQDRGARMTNPVYQPTQPVTAPVPQVVPTPAKPASPTPSAQPQTRARSHPFVVEELTESV